jgi:membrane protease YdiL (CAAX protease family)
MPNAPRNGRALTSVVILSVLLLAFEVERLLVLVPGYREMFDAWGFAVPRSLRSLVEIALVLLAVCCLQRIGLRRGLRELGFEGPVLPALGFAFLAISPMALVFAMAYPLAATFRPFEVFYLAVLSPIAEEAVFRGFAVGQLLRRAGWPLAAAVLLPAALFGYGHARDSDSLAAWLGLFALTGVGAVAFAWLFLRWRTLAAPIGLHVGMNLCWNIWQVGESALAGWVPFALQATVIVLAIVLTLKWTSPAERAPQATAQVGLGA